MTVALKDVDLEEMINSGDLVPRIPDNPVGSRSARLRQSPGHDIEKMIWKLIFGPTKELNTPF